MRWSFILSRLWRGRREMSVLLIALSLVTGFFALGPLYLQGLGESALRYAVDTASPRELLLSLTSATPFQPSDRPVLARELGSVAARVEARTTLSTIICIYTQRLCFGDQDRRAYLPTAYERLTDRFTVTEGRYPTTSNDAAITVAIAQHTGLQVGDTITFYADTPDSTIVQIVGVLAPVAPEDPFWITQTLVTRGQVSDVTENFQRFEMGVIVSESTFAALIEPIGRVSTVYEWYLQTDANALHAADLNQFAAALASVEGTFRRTHPDLHFVSGLRTIITRFQADLGAVEGTVTLFAGGVLLLLLYQLMTTTALILERHAHEWSSMSSRGGSALQLVWMQAGTMTILAALAFVLGLPVAVGVVLMLGRLSPLSSVLGRGFAVTTIPPLSILLSAVAAVVSIVLLTIPAIPAARASLLRLKQSVSRPPTAPIWARYYLDLILIGLSITLLLRLYLVFGGTSLSALLADPASLLHVFTTPGVQNTGLLGDPFNLAIPALLITGIALLWLRLFPWIMQGIGRLFSRSNGVIAPLTLWSIARDPGHYAQLIMILIGTLAIGTASLALAATHDGGTWTSARSATGAEVALTFATEAPPAEVFPAGADRLAHYLVTDPNTGQPTALFGLSTGQFAVLSGTAPETTSQGGTDLPPTATEVSLAVYAETLANGETVHTRLALDVVNALGVPRSIPFTTTDDTVTGRFVSYTAYLPAESHLPYTLKGIRFLSRASASPFQHVIYLDTLSVRQPDGTTRVLDDFEQSALSEWSLQSPTPLPLLATRAHAAGGDLSLRVGYAIVAQGARLIEPILAARSTPGAALIPVILSTDYAQVLASHTRQTPYAVGDTVVIGLPLKEGNRELHARIVGLLSTYPAGGARFLIAPSDALVPFLNATASPETYYADNTVWLNQPERQLNPLLRAHIEALPGLVNIDEAWVVYNQLLRVPLPNAIMGVLFAGFLISLLLGLLDFAFYLAMTASRRATTFAVLRAMGLNGTRLWGLLTAEQSTLIVPAIGIGVLLGVLLASLLIPFLAFAGDEGLLIPVGEIAGLLLVFIVSFMALITSSAIALTRSKIGQALRLGDE